MLLLLEQEGMSTWDIAAGAPERSRIKSPRQAFRCPETLRWGDDLGWPLLTACCEAGLYQYGFDHHETDHGCEQRYLIAVTLIIEVKALRNQPWKGEAATTVIRLIEKWGFADKTNRVDLSLCLNAS